MKNRSFNINLAKINDLISLPGVGEKTAKKIVAYREEHGNFSSLNDLINVKGIGKAKLKKIKNFLNVK